MVRNFLKGAHADAANAVLAAAVYNFRRLLGSPPFGASSSMLAHLPAARLIHFGEA